MNNQTPALLQIFKPRLYTIILSELEDDDYPIRHCLLAKESSLQPWRQTSLLKHVQCHVGMYYSYTEDDSAQSIAASRPQRAAATVSSLQNHTTRLIIVEAI